MTKTVQEANPIATQRGTITQYFRDLVNGLLRVEEQVQVQDDGVSLPGSAIDLDGLPTSDPGHPGRLWNDSGTVKIST